MADEKLSREEMKEKPMSFMTLVVLTGLIGGIIFACLGYLAYIFSFTEIPPRVILEPWALGDWKKGWLGTVIAIILIGVLSIVAALLYYATLRKFNNIWVGIAYGIVLFLLVFFVLNPIFPGIRPINKIDLNTIITSICLYSLFGLFVGYTISYEENEIRSSKKEEEASSA
ncbi:YqhR family membrane protein [Bacillus tuaregi]|uniref:YqhR family membrane protein n=1 Tax=Bacillus tuaregi TaxID=1816695 RepID=UPI0008F800A2|nr:YqhR family membrane protein [Bacillus tuaregi]